MNFSLGEVAKHHVLTLLGGYRFSLRYKPATASSMGCPNAWPECEEQFCFLCDYSCTPYHVNSELNHDQNQIALESYCFILVRFCFTRIWAAWALLVRLSSPTWGLATVELVHQIWWTNDLIQFDQFWLNIANVWPNYDLISSKLLPSAIGGLWAETTSI